MMKAKIVKQEQLVEEAISRRTQIGRWFVIFYPNEAMVDKHHINNVFGKKVLNQAVQDQDILFILAGKNGFQEAREIIEAFEEMTVTCEFWESGKQIEFNEEKKRGKTDSKKR